MTRPTPRSNRFILEAFDRTQSCAVLQALIHVSDLDALRSILGEAAADDPELKETYRLNDQELAAIVEKFNAAFDPKRLEADDLIIGLCRFNRLCEVPYLIHTGCELPLLLDGRKKLACIGHGYPPATFEGEDRFEHWVAKGVLHREVVLDPFVPPTEKWHGHRTVYYTPKGEEWRIPASKLVWQAAGQSGGWNEYFERLEGMLFGYEDWQNDWWISDGLKRGQFGGLPLCCAVTVRGLAWIESAGFRALPPIDGPELALTGYDVDAEAELHAFMLEDPDSTALVCFYVPGRAVMHHIDFRRKGPWRFPADRIPELNSNLKGSVEIVARREGMA